MGNTVRGWRIDAEVAQLVQDYASVRRLTITEAATTLLRRAVQTEMDTDPSLRTAIEAMRAARRQ